MYTQHCWCYCSSYQQYYFQSNQYYHIYTLLQCPSVCSVHFMNLFLITLKQLGFFLLLFAYCFGQIWTFFFFLIFLLLLLHPIPIIEPVFCSSLCLFVFLFIFDLHTFCSALTPTVSRKLTGLRSRMMALGIEGKGSGSTSMTAMSFFGPWTGDDKVPEGFHSSHAMLYLNVTVNWNLKRKNN